MSTDVVVVSDPKVIKVGIEDTRRKILALLRFNDLTVAQIAEVLGKDESTVYRHIEKLRLAGYVRVARERTVHHIPEKVYGRTARVFILSPDDVGRADASRMLDREREEQVRASLRIMAKAGYGADRTGKVTESLLDAFHELDQRTFKIFCEVDDAALADQGVVVRARMLAMLLILEEDKKLARKFSEALRAIIA